ncbi:MAG: hypothetical protein A2836_03105 [Candidatus Taylorbacteria bacterium RIFCSPHIGHO2_01_FULL_45_63]|uniref:Type II secretion system protein GspG C-terminal domain-containing protein n=1 Tax=Candidatus Taylorbacteria bacterium RIFCSPHIGHO2_02_FULL_45_35 TaxID=1802311 RepID=A0A1G2MXL3_9BACT|nr:MAG: hypothetical protein A2836_03105 [Candidatus Taylorbacteria bacterium RIFCSPHIGHO2_01_FULL_45_63]OHA27671.1 MAG: hypothetical protein A3D56_02145 [Candidatus Taylorbacteria bacterium RIFCSPHIGHO2_02_FULL_45_35]OHA32528.1 MAG: hypothetical protein A3A22_03270 [Candidatus Taylorbacteria bacterium RIFCSPLOWO2_01_FULL_45_34b]
MLRLRKNSRGFTLIELLVVISIIGLLSSVVLASLTSARVKARDAKRKATLHQLATANELYFNDVGSYPWFNGWVHNSAPSFGGLVPAYISTVPYDPLYPGDSNYQHWRKDYRGYTCMTLNDASRYGFYAKLENPSTSDPNYISPTVGDSFDRCVATNWEMNYKRGN